MADRLRAGKLTDLVWTWLITSGGNLAVDFPYLCSLIMATHTYPGEGLSLSQLVFALNKELERVAFSAGCVLKYI